MQGVLSLGPAHSTFDPAIGEKKRQTRQLPALTSLRFFATVLVLLRHGSECFGFEKPLHLHGLGLWQGLTCFFVLSGFILTYVHPQIASDKAALRFIGARLARIWPVHFSAFVLLVLACPASLEIANLFPIVLANLSLTHAWILDRSFFGAFNTPCWSLSTEVFFYLCFPYLVRSLANSWKAKLAISLFLALFMVALSTFIHFPEFEPFGASAPPLININAYSRLFEFVIGMVTGLWFLKIGSERPDKPHIGRARSTNLEFLALSLVIGCIAFPKYWHLPESLRYLESLRCWICYCGVAPAYAALIFILALHQGWLSNKLSHPHFVYLGELSFALFLFHYPMFLVFVDLTPYWQSYPLWVVAIAWALSCLTAATFVYEFIEKPCRKALLGLVNSI
jgi:peptidoglycan/LPS O-acetylase OafA/YrhL